MLHSVRARLAAWHTGLLAVLLSLFALVTYLFLQSTITRRAQEYLDSSAAAFVLQLATEREDASSDSSAIAASAAEFPARDLAVVVFDMHGRAVGMNDNATRAATAHAKRDDEPEPALDVVLLAEMSHHLSDVTHPVDFALPDVEGGYRVSVTAIRLAGRPFRVAVAQSRHAETETLETTRTAYLIAIPLMLVVAGVAGSFLAKRSLTPVSAMSAQAARISAANLDDRLPVINPRDELGQLAIVLNELLARVHGALDQQRRFMADASHELRTPVAIMRSEAEVALAVPDRSPHEYREALGVVSASATRLSTIVNELFLLARADAGQQPLRRGTLYLDELVSECVRAVRALALTAGITLRVVQNDVDLTFEGDEELLRRLVINVVENAVKYSGLGALVTVSLSSERDGYRLAVRDTGPGIVPEAQPHVFERFFRADVARSRGSAGAETGGAGAGLGLAIARWIAEAHGGTLVLADSSPAGSEFVLWLPWLTGVPESGQGCDE